MKAITIISLLLSLVIIIEFGYCVKRDCMGTKKEVTTINKL